MSIFYFLGKISRRANRRAEGFKAIPLLAWGGRKQTKAGHTPHLCFGSTDLPNPLYDGRLLAHADPELGQFEVGWAVVTGVPEAVAVATLLQG